MSDTQRLSGEWPANHWVPLINDIPLLVCKFIRDYKIVLMRETGDLYSTKIKMYLLLKINIISIFFVYMHQHILKINSRKEQNLFQPIITLFFIQSGARSLISA